MSTDFINDLMDFDPQNLNVFKETTQSGGFSDPLIYNTNPIKFATSEDGVYRSKVKILLNPVNPKDTIVNSARYWLASADGSRQVRSSLSIGDKSCPIFRGWKTLWFSGDDAQKERAKQLFNKTEQMWVLVQVLEDDNRPELVGKILIWKLPRDVYEKFEKLSNPSPNSKTKPYPITDYVIGKELEIEVQPGPSDPGNPSRRQREISYSLCDFGDYRTCIKTDGTPILTDDEIELVDEYANAFNDANSGRTKKKQDEGAATLEKLRPQLRDIYKKVFDYIKGAAVDPQGNPIDLAKEAGYVEWDEDTKLFVDRWLQIVQGGYDPASTSWGQFQMLINRPQVVTDASPEPLQAEESSDDDLPF